MRVCVLTGFISVQLLILKNGKTNGKLQPGWNQIGRSLSINLVLVSVYHFLLQKELLYSSHTDIFFKFLKCNFFTETPTAAEQPEILTLIMKEPYFMNLD